MLSQDWLFCVHLSASQGMCYGGYFRTIAHYEGSNKTMKEPVFVIDSDRVTRLDNSGEYVITEDYWRGARPDEKAAMPEQKSKRVYQYSRWF